MTTTNPKAVRLTVTKKGMPLIHYSSGPPKMAPKRDLDKWMQQLGRTLTDDSKANLKAVGYRKETKKNEDKDVTTKKTKATTVHRVKSIDYSDEEKGWILRGIVGRARGDREDPARWFEPEKDEAKAQRRNERYLELGRELFDGLPNAFLYFGVSRDEWGSWYDRAMATGEYHKDPFERTTETAMAWYPPVKGPISSRFGVSRTSGSHEGVDIAVPVGTPVRAPESLTVTDVGYSERAGRYVVGEVRRPSGSSFNDNRFRITLAHLSEVQVVEGQTVQRGGTLAQSGATGKVSGPHLHLRVQWIEDVIGPFDREYAIDPLALIPETAFATGQPVPAPGGAAVGLDSHGKPVQVIVAPGATKISVGGHGIINPDVSVRAPIHLQSAEADQMHNAFGGVLRPSSTTPQAVTTTGDPLSGIMQQGPDPAAILQQIADVVGQAGSATIDNLPAILTTVGGLAAAGGAVATAVGTATLQPEILAVSVPVTAGGLGVAGAGQMMQGGGDPLAGIMKPKTTA